jgi:ankyrin repeat protein
MAARKARELGVALSYASRDNMIIDICRLLSQGEDVNCVQRWMHEGKEMSTTPLIEAAFRGHADAVRVLMSRGAEVNKHEPCDGLTALHGAAQRGNKKIAIYLLDHGADVNAKDKHGFTPLSIAAHNGNLPFVDLLILRGADLHLANNQGATPLIMAANNGQFEVVMFLVEKGAVVEELDYLEMTSLSSSIQRRQSTDSEMVDVGTSWKEEINNLKTASERS